MNKFIHKPDVTVMCKPITNPSGVAGLTLKILFFLLLTGPFTGYGQFRNVYGTAGDNQFTKIIPDGSNYYILGTNNGQATVSRINSSGAIQWTRSLNVGSSWSDAALTAGGSLFVVGQTTPVGSTNRSIMGVITQAGTFSWVRSYDAPLGQGGESFRRVARDPSSGNFYVLGFQTDAGSVFLRDVILMSVTSNGSILWKKLFISSGQDDFSGDLEVLSNGDFIVSGNLDGHGVIYRYDAAGNFVTGSSPFDPDPYGYSDLAQRVSGGFYAAGNAAPGASVHLTRFDNDFIPVWDVLIPEMTNIVQIIDRGGGNVYMVGTATLSSGLPQGIIIKISDNGSPSLVWAKHYGNGESGYTAGRIAVSASGDIAFADGRSANPAGFGGFDAFFAVGNLDTDLPCLSEDMVSLEEYSPQYNGVSIELQFYDVPQGTDLASTAVTWVQAVACDPGNAVVSGVKYRECSQAPYSNQPLLSGWVIGLFDALNNPISLDTTDLNGQYSFAQLPAGQYIVRETGKPGWTANVPPSGQSAITLSGSQNIVQNFGNCPSCSCDSLLMTVTPVQGPPDTCKYNLALQNRGAYCFGDIFISVAVGTIPKWTITQAGWVVTPISSKVIKLTPPAGYVPGGASFPVQFCATGSAVYNITINTTWNTGGNTVECIRNFSFDCPPVAPPPCCPAGSTQGPELAANGDFSSGNTGFFSGYTYYAPGNPTFWGKYSVLQSNQIFSANSQWACVDHTTGGATGQMLIVDGSIPATNIAWRETVPVTAGIQYSFVAWVNNLVVPTKDYDDPKVEMWVNNSQVATITLPETPDQWQMLCALWTSNVTGSVNIEIRVGTNTVVGNDFAVDDISFRSCSAPCKADFIVTQVGNCGNYQVMNTSMGTMPFSYQWCDGTTTANPSVQLSVCGDSYTFCVTLTDANNCTSTASQTVTFADTDPPMIQCPQNTTVNTLAGLCYYVGAIPTATATDNCDQNPEIICSILTPNQSILITPATQFPKGVNNITCYARDFCGNSSQNCNFTLTVRDNQPPTITCPLSMSVVGAIDPQGLCKAVVNGIEPSVTDNCPMWNINYAITGATTGSGTNDASGTNFMSGLSTVTYTVTDMDGNSSTCSFSLNVKCDTTVTPIFKCGQAAVTMYSLSDFSSPDGYVLELVDVTNTSSAPLLSNWPAPVYHHPDWKKAKLGEVFGIAIDKNNDIFLTATQTYHGTLFPSAVGPGGFGGIYKVSGLTGAVTTICTTNGSASANTVGTTTLPNTGSGLGNICYDQAHNQFFVTNFEDGRIYRIAAAGNSATIGTVLERYDPFTPDNGTSGAVCLGERLWGVGVFNNRVFFGRWNQNLADPGVGPNEIYSVNLTGTGAFGTNQILETTQSTLISIFGPVTNPVSDIEFSTTGKMLVAERSMRSSGTCGFGTGTHSSRVFEFTGSSGSWSAPQQFYIGHYDFPRHANAAGGVDYGYGGFNTATQMVTGCDQKVWATGDALRLDIQQIYGLAGIPASGNGPSPDGINFAPLNSIYIDTDNNITSQDKTRIGDVDIFKCGCPSEADVCDSISVTSTPSPVETDSCCFNLELHNDKPNYFSGIQLCASNGVSISAVNSLNGWTISGYTSQFIALVPPGGNPAPVGNFDFIKFCLSNYQNVPNQQIIVKYYGPDETVVCMDTLNYNCSKKPKCLKITTDVECAPNGQYKMSFCVMSNAMINWNVNSVQLNAPPGITFTPSVFAVNNLAPGQMQCGFMTLVSGAVDGQTICFSVTAHKEDIVNNPNAPLTDCCTDTVMLACATMPDCVCDKVSASIMPAQVTGSECCWKVTLNNNYSTSFFSGVQLDILTTGVVFGAIANPLGSGWSSTSTPSQAIFKPSPTGTFVGAVSTLPTFCLSGINVAAQVPQTIVLTWLGPNMTAVCRDTFYLDCDPIVYEPCAALVNWKIDCDPQSPGNYLLSFQVTNNSALGGGSGFTANQIVLNNLFPLSTVTPTIISIPPLLPGQTSATQTVSVFGVLPGQNLCFNLSLHNISNGNELDCCTNSQQYCLLIPDCPNNGCSCGTFTNLFVRPAQGAPSVALTCGNDPVTLICPPTGFDYVFTGAFQCQGNNCPPTSQFGWMLISPNGTVTNSGISINANPGFSFTLPNALIQESGVYCLKLTGNCGGMECPCLIKFKIEQPCNNEMCICGEFTDMQFRPSQGAPNMNVVCGDSLTIGCNPNFNPIFYGNFNCMGTNCPPQTLVHWELRRLPSNTLVNSGNLFGPNFSLPLPAAYFNSPGMYTLTFTGQCNGMDCPPCVFKINALGCPCMCGMFEQIKLVNKKTGISQNLTCNNTPTIGLSCPPVGKPYKITGKLVCSPADCKGSNLHWELKAGGTVIASGNQPGPWFSITLDQTLLAGLNGLYNLVLTGTCGTDVCTCVLHFDIAGCPVVPPCPCDNTFNQNVAAGFTYTFDFNGGTCKWLFTPAKLDECDKVTWEIKDKNGPFMANGSTTSSQTFTATFPNNTISTYQICMTVTRPGTNCVSKFCQDVPINCLLTPVCNLNILGNEGFEEGGNAGILGLDGSSAGWTRTAGMPEIVEGGACAGLYSISLVGKCWPIPIDIVDHPITVGTVKGFNIKACYKAPEENLRPGTSLVVRLTDDHLDSMNCGAGCTEIARIPINAATGGEWHNIAASFYLDGVSGQKFLNLHLENDLQYDDPDANSVVAFDNICFALEESTSVGTNSAPESGTNIRIVPNPNTGIFTVELPEPANQQMTLYLTDLAGRLVLEKQIDQGTTRQMVDGSSLPNGLYFVQVIYEGKLLKTQKLVKQ